MFWVRSSAPCLELFSAAPGGNKKQMVKSLDETGKQVFYSNEKMPYMLNIAVIEEHNSRAMKNRAEQNEMTNAFNILKKTNSIGKQA